MIITLTMTAQLIADTVLCLTREPCYLSENLATPL